MLHTEQNFITEQERVAVKQKVLDLEEHLLPAPPDQKRLRWHRQVHLHQRGVVREHRWQVPA